LDAFLDVFFGASSESESDWALDCFLETFFGAGSSESDPDPDEEEDSFFAALAAAFLAAGLATTFSDSSEESESEELSTFLAGTFFFSEVFWAFLALPALALEAALGRLATGLASEESESLELEETCFFCFFLSTDCFLTTGASEELSLSELEDDSTCFFYEIGQ